MMKHILLITLLLCAVTSGCQTNGTEPVPTIKTTPTDEQEEVTPKMTIVIPSELPETESEPMTTSSLKARIMVPSEQAAPDKEELKAKIYISSEDS